MPEAVLVITALVLLAVALGAESKSGKAISPGFAAAIACAGVVVALLAAFCPGSCAESGTHLIANDAVANELNTEVINTDDSLLKQITGDENKALLSFDGTNFIIQGLINTDNVVEGENYRFSAELRKRDLIL